MRYSVVVASTFVAAAYAQTQTTKNAFEPITGVTAGKATTLKWQDASTGDCTLILRKGASSNLDTMDTIGTTPCSSGSFVFTPKSSLTDGSDYAIEIKSSEGSNFSPQFPITGGSGTGAETTSSADTSSDNSTATTTATVPDASSNSTDTNSTTATMPSPTSSSEETATTTKKPYPSGTKSSVPSPSGNTSAAGIYKVSFGALFGGLMLAVYAL
jgi:hypothetical protein